MKDDLLNCRIYHDNENWFNILFFCFYIAGAFKFRNIIFSIQHETASNDPRSEKGFIQV